MPEANLPKPDIDDAKAVIDEHFARNPSVSVVEAALDELLRRYPENTNVSHVILKVAAINQLYSTQIYAVYDAARRIHSIPEIDSRLQQGDLDLVSEIAMLSVGNKVRNNLSFASKYCSWHNQAAFPILDSNVRIALRVYRDRNERFQFDEEALWDYRQFHRTVSAFREAFGLTDLDFKSVDKFLWVKGDEIKRAGAGAKVGAKS